eukprot:m.14720 g.14720  ORF g.14720 m.14720 type:complete len:322 (+) comp25921_c0_seq1:163-1128(+)
MHRFMPIVITAGVAAVSVVLFVFQKGNNSAENSEISEAPQINELYVPAITSAAECGGTCTKSAIKDNVNRCTTVLCNESRPIEGVYDHMFCLLSGQGLAKGASTTTMGCQVQHPDPTGKPPWTLIVLPGSLCSVVCYDVKNLFETDGNYHIYDLPYVKNNQMGSPWETVLLKAKVELCGLGADSVELQKQPSSSTGMASCEIDHVKQSTWIMRTFSNHMKIKSNLTCLESEMDLTKKLPGPYGIKEYVGNQRIGPTLTNIFCSLKGFQASMDESNCPTESYCAVIIKDGYWYVQASETDNLSCAVHCLCEVNGKDPQCLPI